MAFGFRVIFRKGFPTLTILKKKKKNSCFLSVFLSFLFLFRFLIHLGFVLALGCRRDPMFFFRMATVPSQPH